MNKGCPPWAKNNNNNNKKSAKFAFLVLQKLFDRDRTNFYPASNQQ